MVAGVGADTAADVMTCHWTHHYIGDNAAVVAVHGVGHVHMPLGSRMQVLGVVLIMAVRGISQVVVEQWSGS